MFNRYGIRMIVKPEDLGLAVQVFSRYNGSLLGKNDLTVSARNDGWYELKFHVWGKDSLNNAIFKYVALRSTKAYVCGILID